MIAMGDIARDLRECNRWVWHGCKHCNGVCVSVYSRLYPLYLARSSFLLIDSASV